MDASFYERFYSQMTKGTFIGMTGATPEKFQFSIKVPETITHIKRTDVQKGAIFRRVSRQNIAIKNVRKVGCDTIPTSSKFHSQRF
jgi:uncharacterized protein YecE (DUF72 family)